MDARESQHIRNFGDGPLVFLNQNLRLRQLQVGDVLLGRNVDVGPEQILQR